LKTNIWKNKSLLKMKTIRDWNNEWSQCKIRLKMQKIPKVSWIFSTALRIKKKKHSNLKLNSWRNMNISWFNEMNSFPPNLVNIKIKSTLNENFWKNSPLILEKLSVNWNLSWRNIYLNLIYCKIGINNSNLTFLRFKTNLKPLQSR